MLKKILRLYLFRNKWRKSNSHNETTAINFFPAHIVSVGKRSYGPLEVHHWGAENEKLIIGRYVSIASGVKFLLGGNHRHDTFSTFPFKVKVGGEKREAWSKGMIKVEDDVWIGTDALIMSGVTIGKGAVIAAGSIVTKDVPPFAIVGGNPAKVIKFRFNQELIGRMMDFDYQDLDESKVKENIDLLYQPVSNEVIDKMKQ